MTAWTLFWTAIAAAPAPTAPPAQPSPMTWEQVVKEVERTHPLMDAARAGLANFEAKLSQADWAYFPRFRMDVVATLTPKVTGNALDSDTDWGTVGGLFRWELELVQPVYTFGKIGALKRAARAGIDIGQAQVEAARWELRFRLGQAWHGSLMALELEKILEDGRKWLDKAQERMERLREEDSDDYDQLEHLRLKTRVAEFYELDAENKRLAIVSRQGLRVLLSRAPGIDVAIASDALEPVEYDFMPVEKYLELAMLHEPTLLQARHGAKAQRALADHREAELLPDLVLVGSANVAVANEIEDQGSRFANDPFNGSGAAGFLALRWNLDVPNRLFRAEEARATALRTEMQGEVQADLVEVRVRELHQQLDNKRELIKIFANSQRAAQGWLTATWDTYDAGFGSFRDVMDALVQFYGKKLGYLQQVFEHNVLLLELSRAIGYDVTAIRRAAVNVSVPPTVPGTN